MNISECYEQFNGDYKDVIARLSKEERIERYCKKFLEGDDYNLIFEALKNEDYEEAFRNVHNLKGLSLNLGFTPLHEVSDELCEYLRANAKKADKSITEEILLKIKEANDKIKEAIEAYFS